MPLYDYRCTPCDKVFEVVQKIKDSKRKGMKCPLCGGKKTHRIMSGFRLGAIVGSGDTTSIIKDKDGNDYRLKERTAKDQKREIQRELERAEQEKISKGEIDPRFRMSFDVN